MKVMKYILFAITTILIIGLLSFKSADEQLLPTKLRITVIDNLGNPTEGVAVTIYEKEEDYIKNENPVDSALTDEKGRVTFSDVKPIVYYIDARKEDMNNDGQGVVTSELKEGRLNKINTVIE